MVTVTVGDSRTGPARDSVTCTPEHPLYAVGKGWTAADALVSGDCIATRAGSALVVQSVKWQQSAAGFRVCNLTVDGDHTYFVGVANGGLWAHNVWCGGQLPSEAEARAAAEEKAGFSLDDVYAETEELHPGSRLPSRAGAPGIRTVWRHPYTEVKVHLDPNGTYYGPGDPENIMPHYGVEIPGQPGTEHFTWQDYDEGFLNQLR